MHKITAARREPRLALALVIFYAAHSGKLLYRRYETPSLPLHVYKKASLSEDHLGLARSPRYPELFDIFIQLPARRTAARAADHSCPIFFFVRLPRFLIFRGAIWKNYVARARARVMALSCLLLPAPLSSLCNLTWPRNALLLSRRNGFLSEYELSGVH